MNSILNTMNESLVNGNSVSLSRTMAKHIKVAGQNEAGEIPSELNFADLVRKGMNEANKDQIESSNMFVQMITEPDSLEAHDVSIAMAKANMSLQMTKSIVDGAVQAYKDIINMR
ncbi:MAG: flagellar hook-basal body complex protein FliE [Spirochaetaceae bacterium 4572_59]|nr:MAG: flagellar hook-basal body complex protein FliE [Spirochaetaceae bacterium 4572_59]